MTFWRGVYAGFVGEIQKIRSLKRFTVLMVFWGLCIVFRGLPSQLLASYIGYYTGNLLFSVLGLARWIFCPLAVFLLSAELFSTEMESGSIKSILVRPVARHSIVLSKFLAIMQYVGLMLLLGFVLAAITDAIFFGPEAVRYFRAFLAYVLTLLPLAALCAMSVCLGTCFKSGVGCFFFSLLAYCLFLFLGLFFSFLYPAFFTSYFNLGSMVIGSVVPVMNLLIGIVILAGYTMLFLSAASILFQKKEF